MQEPTPCEINQYLTWLEETDHELCAMHNQARVIGVIARVIHGKYAVVPWGMPEE